MEVVEVEGAVRDNRVARHFEDVLLDSLADAKHALVDAVLYILQASNSCTVA